MIIFRPLGHPVPPYWEPDLHWQVEFWPDDADVTRPYGVAWVSAYDGTVIAPYLDYLIVCDDCRRQGVAKALIAACRERWPGIRLTDAISPEGEALLESVGE